MPRPLANVRHGDTRIQLFGQQFEHPLLLAPIAYQRLFHADGESASAMAARCTVRANGRKQPCQPDTRTNYRSSRASTLFQLYWQGNRERTLQLAKRALAAGYHVIVFTVDAPVKQATMQLPTGISATNLAPPSAATIIARESEHSF